MPDEWSEAPRPDGDADNSSTEPGGATRGGGADPAEPAAAGSATAGYAAGGSATAGLGASGYGSGYGAVSGFGRPGGGEHAAYTAWTPAPPASGPGAVPVAPLGTGDILRRVFGTLRRYSGAVYVPLFAAALVGVLLVGTTVGVVVLSLGDLFSTVWHDPEYYPTESEHARVITMTAVTAAVMVSCVVAVAAVGATTTTALLRHSVLGRPVGPRQLWRESRALVWRVLGARLLLSLASLAVLLVSLLPALALGLTTNGGQVVGVGLLCGIPGGLLALYVRVRLALLVPALVLERRPLLVTIRRAWLLNEGAWWRSLGIPCLVGAIGTVAAQVAIVPFTLVGLMFLGASTGGQAGGGGQVPAPGGTAVLVFLLFPLLGFVAANTLAAPLAPLTNGLLYIDRRIRREGLDRALSAEAAASIPALLLGVPTGG